MSVTCSATFSSSSLSTPPPKKKNKKTKKTTHLICSSCSSSHVAQPTSALFHWGVAFITLVTCMFPVSLLIKDLWLETVWNLSATLESACAPRTRLLATLGDVGTEGMSVRLIKWIWTQSPPWSCKNMWTFWNVSFICGKVLFLSFAVNLQSLWRVKKNPPSTGSNSSEVCGTEIWKSQHVQTIRTQGKKSFVGMLGRSEQKHSKINKPVLHYICVWTAWWTVRAKTNNNIYPITF